jgi:WD40 repeat protein
MKARLGVLGSLMVAATASAQLQSLQTANLDLVYYGVEKYLTTHVARCFEDALQQDRKLLDWTPSERVTIFLNDFGDTGNAAATAIPVNRIVVTIEPFSHAFEVILANERMNMILNHELIHVMAIDKAAARDRTYRKVFGGKVLPTSENPLSMIYSYYTTPRLYAPSWYHEGFAVFMETWRTGGFGRALGAYDEMVFRTKVADNAEIYDLVGLASAATKLDFQVGVNAYLYGARFVSYLALTYGPEKAIKWLARTEDSQPGYGAQFQAVFGEPLPEVWSKWISWERSFQERNLEGLRKYPITPYRKVTDRALGSVSRPIIDRGSDTLFIAVAFPGQVSHIMSVNLKTRATRKLIEVKGPTLFAVTSLAFDPSSRTLFYTTNNRDWRDLRGVNVDTGRSRTYIKTARIGDLAFNLADKSLWGVRTFNGISTLVRIPPPYTEWHQVHSFDYGTDFYDLDISPDGKQMVAALTKPSGNQSLVMMNTGSLLRGDASFEVLSDFENSSPANFVFSPDGRYLYGSSFYSGVSNLYRVDLEAKDVQVITNADTGYFRPVPLSTTEVLAFRYTGKGFLPVVINSQPVERVNAITFLGQRIVETYPVVKEWKLPPPSSIDLAAMIQHEGPYSSLENLRKRSLYPIVEGYKNTAAVGLRLNLADTIGYNRLNMSLSYSPSTSLSTDQRFHFKAGYSYLGWKLIGTYNYANFYDLFGPTKQGFKGYSLGVSYKRYIIYDQPNRTLDWAFDVTGYGGLDTLPGFQNVAVSATQLGAAHLSLGYSNVRSSLGSVEPEKGLDWRATASEYYAVNESFPKLRFDLNLGLPLPISHTSVWLYTSAGVSGGNPAKPYGNFYFGGFGNNYVDDKEYRRYHEPDSFPGVKIDEIAGHDYGKALLEINLPPVVFKHVGKPSLFANWASLALFAGGITANPGNSSPRQNYYNVGAQMDIRLVGMSLHQFTLSFGYAAAYQGGTKISDEFMASFKIPFYD